MIEDATQEVCISLLGRVFPLWAKSIFLVGKDHFPSGQRAFSMRAECIFLVGKEHVFEHRDELLLPCTKACLPVSMVFGCLSKGVWVEVSGRTTLALYGMQVSSASALRPVV